MPRARDTHRAILLVQFEDRRIVAYRVRARDIDAGFIDERPEPVGEVFPGHTATEIFGRLGGDFE